MGDLEKLGVLQSLSPSFYLAGPKVLLADLENSKNDLEFNLETLRLLSLWKKITPFCSVTAVEGTHQGLELMDTWFCRLCMVGSSMLNLKKEHVLTDHHIA